MLVTFTDHTGAAKEGTDKGKSRPADPNGQRALDYLLGEVVNKPSGEDGRIQPTRRTRAPELLSGDPWLFRQTCAQLQFKNRYASGTLAFERGDIDAAAFAAGDQSLRELCTAIMRDFEETAFAGIPEEEWPHILWIAHTDKGNLELNFLFPRAVANGNGELRSFNPKPPGRLGNELWDSFRNLWNRRYGFADPDDPTRSQALKLPRSVLKKRGAATEGDIPSDIRQILTHKIEDEIEAGRIENRDQVKAYLIAQGYKINRESGDFLSVLPKAEAGKSTKPIRLKGHIYNQDFNGLDWLVTRYEAQPKAEFTPEVEKRLQAELDKMRVEHGDFLRERLRYPAKPQEAAPRWEPRPETSQDEQAKGFIEAEQVPQPQQAEAEPAGEQPQKPRRSYQSKLWTQTFGEELPSDLQAKLRYVDPIRKTVWLADKSSIRDDGDKIKAFRAKEDTLRLMIIQARAKGWSGINVRANDKQTLIQATRLAFAEGIEIKGRNDHMQAIIAEELTKLRLAAEQGRQSSPEPQAEPALTIKTGPKPRSPQPFDPLAEGHGEAFALDKGPTPPRQYRPFNQIYTEPNASALSTWDSLYGYGTLPKNLRPVIKSIITNPKIVSLADKAKVQDLGPRITVTGSSEDALRVVIAQAMAKGWTGLSVRGNEGYLRMAAKVAAETGFPIKARDEAMQAILDEVQKENVESTSMVVKQSQPMHTPPTDLTAPFIGKDDSFG